jgi:heme A synthase
MRGVENTRVPETSSESDVQADLVSLYEDQRRELDFRRGREQAIFLWSNSILVAVIGWTAVTEGSASTVDSLDRLLGGLGVLALALWSAWWQRHQRSIMRAHQRVLARIAVERGWFNLRDSSDGTPLLPEKWQRWGSDDSIWKSSGSKVWATYALGIVASLAVIIVGP